MFLFLVLGSEPTFLAVAPEHCLAFEHKYPQTALVLSERALTNEEMKRVVMYFMKLYAAALARGSTLSGREAVTVAAMLFLQNTSSSGRMAA